MSEDNKKIMTIDEYILQYPEDIQVKLQELRRVIRSEAIDAKEKMSYMMPTFDLYGNLVHFAVHKNHIGFYPGDTGILKYKELLNVYKHSKGAVQFPLNQPLPLDLISEIVRFRVQENIQLVQDKKNKNESKSQ